MTRYRRIAGACAIAGLLIACSPGGEAPPPAQADAAAEAARGRGEAIVQGRAPVLTGGQSAIVILEPQQPRDVRPQAAKPVMDQISQVFTPGVLIVRTGEPAEFRNSDETLHNIRVRNEETREAAFNIALPTGQTFEYAFQQDGFYDVGCDIHPAMSAVVIATKSPYSAIAGTDGAFTIEGVPAGSYNLTIYADVRKIERTIEVTPGRTELGVLTP